MNVVLKEALDELLLLPEDLQNQIALDLLEEVKWEKELYKNESKNKTNTNLNKLVSKAKKEHSEDKTHNIGFDEL